MLSLLLQRGIAIISNQTLIRRKVKHFDTNFCKYYLVMAVLVERKMYSTVCYHVWLKSKNQIDARRRWWVVSRFIDYWWSLWKEVIDSSRVLSILPTSPDYQLEDLALKSPVINSKWRLKLVRYTVRCAKVLIKGSYSLLETM